MIKRYQLLPLDVPYPVFALNTIQRIFKIEFYKISDNNMAEYVLEKLCESLQVKALHLKCHVQ